jgi:hypothetical protein
VVRIDLYVFGSICSVGGKKSAIEIDSSIWREEIGNRNRLVNNLAGRKSDKPTPRFGGFKLNSTSVLAGRNRHWVLFWSNNTSLSLATNNL